MFSDQLNTYREMAKGTIIIIIIIIITNTIIVITNYVINTRVVSEQELIIL